VDVNFLVCYRGINRASDNDGRLQVYSFGGERRHAIHLVVRGSIGQFEIAALDVAELT
jgi:hypothetical protein